MDIKTLIDIAVRAKGGRAPLAAELQQDPQRLTDWKAGRRKPEAGEIAYLADVAGLRVIDTVAEIEQQLRPAYASVWQKALAQAVAKSLIQLFGLSSKGPNTGRCGPYFGWFGSCA